MARALVVATPEPLTGLQPSMSLSALLIECSFPFGKELDTIGNMEAALYGRAFHELLALRLSKQKLQGRTFRRIAAKHQADPDELQPHVNASYDELLRWLGRNEFRVDFGAALERSTSVFVERALALRPGVSARFIDPHDDTHRYLGVGRDEQPGTLDFGLHDRRLPLLLLDHKSGEEDYWTGESFSRPLDIAQLLSLIAAFMRVTGRTEGIVGVLHARRRGLPKVYADKVKLSELRKYEGRVAVGLSRIGDGSLRPGPWCTWCPAREVCPARDAQLVEKAGDILTGLTAAGGALSKDGLVANDLAIVKAPPSLTTVEKKMGLLYSIAKKSELMAERVRAEIRDAIEASGGSLLPETPEGEYLVVREYEKESVSKSSIVEAYGKVGGERLLGKLRRDGAITKRKVKQLWPEKDRGR